MDNTKKTIGNTNSNIKDIDAIKSNADTIKSSNKIAKTKKSYDGNSAMPFDVDNYNINDSLDGIIVCNRVYNFGVNKWHLANVLGTIEEIVERIKYLRVNSGDASEEYDKLLIYLRDRIFDFERHYLLYYIYSAGYKFRYNHITKLMKIIKKFQIIADPNFSDFNIIGIIKDTMKYLDE